jgi:hypothetical protein
MFSTRVCPREIYCILINNALFLRPEYSQKRINTRAFRTKTRVCFGVVCDEANDPTVEDVDLGFGLAVLRSNATAKVALIKNSLQFQKEKQS